LHRHREILAVRWVYECRSVKSGVLTILSTPQAHFLPMNTA
jgi:hypothetical protein